tara:strand:+ start:5839 stop:6384 length:546 start_codon:yes stop_codon:yes gene_type:complete
MGKQFASITPKLATFIAEQKMFFVGTAMPEGRVNISPKGMDSFRVINGNQVVWQNLTGSGNETATHLRTSPRMTIMFAAFEGNPMILRLYGTAKVYHPRDKSFEKWATLFPANAGSRQFIEMEVDLVQTSCGYAVPLMDFKEDRHLLTDWTGRKGEEGVKAYWEKKNTVSIDGHNTHILED